MAVSQNGYRALSSPPAGRLPQYVTGRVLPGDVQTVFDYLCRRFHTEVEPIIAAHSWGWAYRPIRGATTTSNHASGTAIDLNAPRHPLGRANTFTPTQQSRIRAILRDLQGVIRWGGDYSRRKDDMHFEIDKAPDEVRRVANMIRSGVLPGGEQEDDMPAFRDWPEADKKAMADYLIDHPVFKDQHGKIWRVGELLRRSATSSMVKDQFQRVFKMVRGE